MNYFKCYFFLKTLKNFQSAILYNLTDWKQIEFNSKKTKKTYKFSGVFLYNF